MDYDKIVGDAKNLWRQRLTDIMRSTTPLFIGLSGADSNLTNMLTEVQQIHPSKGTDHYWGIRLTANDDKNSSIWDVRGVRSFECSDFSQIPPLLMDVCRQAAEARAKGVTH
jgi:hypothetical protein